MYEALQQAVMNMEAAITDFGYITEQEEQGEKEETEVIPADPDVKNYTYTFVDGMLYFRKDSGMYLQKVGEKPLERIKGMHVIREATRHLIDIQMEGCMEEEFKAAQSRLNEVYDSYVRPAIVLSRNEYNEHSPIMQVAPMTKSRKGLHKKYHVLVKQQYCSNLRGPGMCMLEQTRPIDRRQVAYKIGSIKCKKLIHEIDQAVSYVTGLEDVNGLE